MRTLTLLLLLGAVSQGKLRDNQSLTDLLKRYISRMESVDNPMSSDSPLWSSNYPVSTSDNPMSPDYQKTVTWKPPASTTIQPSYGSMEGFDNLEEAFLFPGSWYLVRLIEQYIENSRNEPLEVEDIKDFFQVPECDMGDLRTIFKVYKMMTWDPESVALLATRMFAKPILMERMKCPAAIFDTTIIKVLMQRKEEFMQTEDESLYTFFQEMAPLVDPAFQPYADEIAESAVHEFHGAIFNESIEYIIGFGFKDWAYSTHRLFSELVDFFRYFNPDQYSNSEMDLKYRIENVLWEVRCPDSYEVIGNHKNVVWKFKEVFGMVETGHICPRVVDFLYEFIQERMPGYAPSLENNSHLDAVCETLKDVIDEIVTGYSEYENKLFSSSIQEFEELLRDVLRPEEWRLFEEAFRRLGLDQMSPWK